MLAVTSGHEPKIKDRVAETKSRTKPVVSQVLVFCLLRPEFQGNSKKINEPRTADVSAARKAQNIHGTLIFMK